MIDPDLTGANDPEATTAHNLGETVAHDPEAITARDPDATSAPDPDATTAHDPAASAIPAIPGQRVRYIGDYELISLLGRGGMGVVYRARQITLNRQVALKMISNSEFASADQLRRFQNEAEAVAALDHPGIVPIYEVGTFEDQRYFSMKLIDGRGMEKALADLKADPREAARIVAEVADAVYHAHQRGILHRDLKPANILLDHESHAHVTDFGLAKRIEGEEGVTLSGSVLGTPAYMSPEQAAGQISAITTLSDVYGLGAILFAALTHRAPFVGDSLMMTLDRVRTQPPEPPSRLSTEVPRDLDVICLKCLEKNPRQRYESAQALGDDLRRWLSGEPITARPVGPSTRLAMWARRNPALAGLSLALLAALIVGVAGIAWQWREAVGQRNRALTQERIAREAEVQALRQEGIAREAEKKAALSRDAAQASEKVAVAARAEAEKNYQLAATQATLALNTIQDLVTRVSSGLNQPGLFDLKTEIIQKALDRVDAVANIYQGTTNKEATTFAALFELAKIYHQTGKIEKATRIFRQCLDIARARVVIKKGSDPARQNLVNVLGELAGCSIELDRDLKAAVAYDREAMKVLQDILDHPMRQDRVIERKVTLKNLGYYHYRIGTSLLMVGDLVRSLEEYRQAYNVHAELLAGARDDPELIRTAALDALTLGNGSYLLGRREAAEDYFQQSLDLIEQFDRARKGAPDARLLLASYRSVVGLYRFRIGERAAARREYQSARDEFLALKTADPQNIYYRSELVVVLGRLGRLEDTEQKPDAARLAFEEATRLAEENFRVDEKNDLRRMALLKLLPRVGQVERALEMAERMAAGPKVDAELWVDLACCYAQCARSEPPEKAKQASACQLKAVDAVRRATRSGFRDKIALEVEPDLDPIRSRDDFQTLLREMPPPG
jgi:tetratricopeptide (TPR) repeat protein/tRNA A-37 threonylcarbamoyl transferase component Bud32